MARTDGETDPTVPLLADTGDPLPQASYTTVRKSSDSDRESASDSEAQSEATDLHRSIEDDVLPETAVLGRNIGWSSAYIIIISRVIGSGIFATPGAIVSSVGSIGLSLLLWLVGAVISWSGLAISLEYGCMLPRSGGMLALFSFSGVRGIRGRDRG